MRLPRHWLIIARRGAGKSTLASAMSPEYLVADFDGRWAEQTERAEGKSHIIRESEPLKLVAKMFELKHQLQGYVKTIIFDSGTAVLDFLQSRGRLMENEARQNKQKFNLNELHKLKADTMRLLRNAALQWHCDIVWIFHIEDNMESGKAGERTTISKLEMERMKANLNAVLTIVQDKTGKRGVRIEWCRYHNNAAMGQIIWDDVGEWKGVPEKLDDFIANYTGSEGYNGNSYSGEWLLEFLRSKGKEFPDVEEMYKALDLKEEPRWFDRSGWGKYIEKALA